jgi:hypothetical protein
MWWIPIILVSCALIVTKHAMYRANAFSWGIVGIAAVLVILAEIGFWKGLRLAPSFFQPWFLGHVALALFGIVASLILGDKGITTQHYVGMAMALGAGYLLAT